MRYGLRNVCGKLGACLCRDLPVVQLALHLAVNQRCQLPVQVQVLLDQPGKVFDAGRAVFLQVSGDGLVTLRAHGRFDKPLRHAALADAPTFSIGHQLASHAAGDMAAHQLALLIEALAKTGAERFLQAVVRCLQ